MSKMNTVRSVFVVCQEHNQCPSKLVKQLKKIYASMDYDEFWEEFLYHLRYSMIVFKREIAVERTLNFVANFATSCKPTDDKENNEKDTDDDEEGVEEQEMGKFLRKMFEFLLQHHNAADKAVRFRCCQLINKLLGQMSDEAEIDDALYDRIQECMLVRMHDKVPQVQVQAVLALSRLQDPTDPDCQVIKAYVFLIGRDPISYVRKAVLSSIVASTQTLASILERTRDTNPAVRRLAYCVIAEKIHIKALTIAQRVKLLEQGLKDRQEAVQDACACRLLQAWLRLHEGNILELLHCLDVENSLETSKQALLAMMKKSTPSELVSNFDLLDDKLVITPEKLTCESALYWKTLCEYLKEQGNEVLTELDKILPTTYSYAQYLFRVMAYFQDETDVDKKLDFEFIVQQLLGLAQILDLSDEAGRKELDRLVMESLSNELVMPGLVKPLLSLYSKLCKDPNQRINNLVEAISDIREPITIVEKKITQEQQHQLDLKLAGIRVEINQLKEDMHAAVTGQDYGKAAEIKEKIESLDEQKLDLLTKSQPQSQEVKTVKNDPATMLKCLTIAAEMLPDIRLRTLSPTLLTLIETLMLPGIQNEEPAVRNMAVKALGLCCQMSSATARDHLLLFLQVLQIDQETVKVSALRCIFDLLTTFGLETFGAKEQDTQETNDENDILSEDRSAIDTQETEAATDDDLFSTSQESEPAAADQRKTLSSMISILTGLLDNQCSELRTVAAEGLAKLMLSGRVISSRLMSRLLLLWYNPVTEDDLLLRHCLGTFFPIFAFSGKVNQLIIEDAFLPTLNTLFNAPASSPLAEVNVGNVAELLVQLTNPRNLLANQNATNTSQIEDGGTHLNIAVKVSNEILSNPNSFSVRTYCKVLRMLDFSTADVGSLKDLAVLANKMVQDVKDKQSARNVERYKETIDHYLRTKGVQDPEPMVPLKEPPHSSQDTLSETLSQTSTRTGNRTLLSHGDSMLTADSPKRSPIIESADSLFSSQTTDRPQASSQEAPSTAGTDDITDFVSQTPSTQSALPASQKKTKSHSSLRKSRKKQLEEEIESSDSDIENNAAKTPTPVRRSTRKRKGSKRRSEDQLCTKLSMEDEAERDLVVALERIPLSDVENQVI